MRVAAVCGGSCGGGAGAHTMAGVEHRTSLPRHGPLRRSFGRGVALLAVLVAGGVGHAEDVVEPPDAGPDAPAPATPVCIEEPSSARREVQAAFEELQRIHRNRVPGPSGQRLLEGRVDELLERLVAFDVFVDLVLGEAWEEALAEQRAAWRETLEETLRRRYLKKLGSPLSSHIEMKGVVLRCNRAEVIFVVVSRRGEHRQEVTLELDGVMVDGEPRWRAFDVAVDGVSLLETWKSRFRRIYADGGVAAIDYHMRGLRERYNRRGDP